MYDISVDIYWEKKKQENRKAENNVVFLYKIKMSIYVQFIHME